MVAQSGTEDNQAVNQPNHPGLRPTRYHWAAGTNVLHWLPAIGGWSACAVLGALGTSGTGAASLNSLAALCALGALSWSGLWLLIVPALPTFRRVIDSRLGAKFENDYAYQSDLVLQRASPALLPYLRAISSLRNKAREIMLRRFGKHDPFAQDNLAKLDKLAISYLQLLSTLADYDDYLSVVDANHLTQEIAATQAGLANADEELRTLRERQLLLLQNRLARYRKVEGRLTLLKEEASSIETTMKLLADQAMTTPESRSVWGDIDTVLDNIKESELLSADLAVFDEFERTASRSAQRTTTRPGR
jgi:hypothetical protein